MSAASRPRYSIEEYVRFEESANAKHEFFDGQIIAMAGGTLEHAAMASAVNASFRTQLGGRGCEAYTSDARVRITSSGLDTYPDVAVVCGPVVRDTGDKNAMTNPTVLVEVTSDSTESYDRGEKFAQYKTIDSLQAVVFVAHRRPGIDVYSRQPDGTWARDSHAGAGETASIDAIKCTLSVDDVFRAPVA